MWVKDNLNQNFIKHSKCIHSTLLTCVYNVICTWYNDYDVIFKTNLKN